MDLPDEFHEEETSIVRKQWRLMGFYSIRGETRSGDPCVVFYNTDTRNHRLYTLIDDNYCLTNPDLDTIFGLRLDSSDGEYEAILGWTINDPVYRIE